MDARHRNRGRRPAMAAALFAVCCVVGSAPAWAQVSGFGTDVTVPPLPIGGGMDDSTPEPRGDDEALRPVNGDVGGDGGSRHGGHATADDHGPRDGGRDGERGARRGRGRARHHPAAPGLTAGCPAVRLPAGVGRPRAAVPRRPRASRRTRPEAGVGPVVRRRRPPPVRMSRPAAAVPAGELVPLADRLVVLQAVRLAMAVVVVATTVLVPRTAGRLGLGAAMATLCYVGLTVAAEAARRWARVRALS